MTGKMSLSGYKNKKQKMPPSYIYIVFNGKIWRVIYLANESFELTWRISIWRLRRGYYSTDVAVNLAIDGQIPQIAKLKLPPNFPVIRYIMLQLVFIY